jgi:myo-inositol-1-phosphate synthase
MSRKKLEIDPKLVENYARLGASNTEIAGLFNCDEGTIRKRFSEILLKARSTRKVKLRELQWKQAEKGNITMLIWLGKQELGQSDKIEQANTNLHTFTPATKEQLLKVSDQELLERYKKAVE